MGILDSLMFGMGFTLAPFALVGIAIIIILVISLIGLFVSSIYKKFKTKKEAK